MNEKTARGLMTNSPHGQQITSEDDGAIRHGRDFHKGFRVGQYLQAPPFFFTRDKWPLPLVDNYRGATAFLIASGPSFLTHDYKKLYEPGILTMGLNNSVATFRPKLWTCVDTPSNFIRSIWLDPTIQKIVPIDHSEKPIFNSDTWKMTDTKVGDCPNVIYYKRNEKFIASQFLWEDSINWGNHSDWGGKRSCMLPAVRILFLLGVRTIFLCGVDFNMSDTDKYHFAQSRSPGSISGNNETYEELQQRFTQLRPIFEQNGLQVYNCNKDSRLTAFDHVPFEEAFGMARSVLPENLTGERTEGMYDRKANEKKRAKQQQKAMANHLKAGNAPERGAACDVASAKHKRQIISQVKAAREALHAAKGRTVAAAGEPAFDKEELKSLIKSEQEKREMHRHLVAVRKSVLGY